MCKQQRHQVIQSLDIAKADLFCTPRQQWNLTDPLAHQLGNGGHLPFAQLGWRQVVGVVRIGDQVEERLPEGAHVSGFLHR